LRFSFSASAWPGGFRLRRRLPSLALARIPGVVCLLHPAVLCHHPAASLIFSFSGAEVRGFSFSVRRLGRWL